MVPGCRRPRRTASSRRAPAIDNPRAIPIEPARSGVTPPSSPEKKAAGSSRRILAIGRRLRDRKVIAACLVNLAAVTLHAREEAVEWPYSLADAREWLLEASSIL